jgi:trehalose 6-phosphate phosphatase
LKVAAVMDDWSWTSTIHPASTAFFLDVDGTLLGFKDRPQEVVGDDQLRDLLQKLLQVSGGAVALISGRTIEDIDRIVAPLVLPVAGVHGAAMRLPDGRTAASAEAGLARVRDAAATFVIERPGLSLEEKGGAAFAIHFRAAPDRAEEVAEFLQSTVVDPKLAVQHGKMVVEVKPAGCNKGVAVQMLMREAPFEGRSPLFIGDDLTDEYGFDAVNRMSGLSVKVGPGETIAQQRVPDVAAARRLLFELGVSRRLNV